MILFVHNFANKLLSDHSSNCYRVECTSAIIMVVNGHSGPAGMAGISRGGLEPEGDEPAQQYQLF